MRVGVFVSNCIEVWRAQAAWLDVQVYETNGVSINGIGQQPALNPMFALFQQF